LSASIAAMYQDGLLAHYRAPHNRRELKGATGRATRKNPVCGDEITVMALVDDAVLSDVSFTGRGCSIATASASMMTDAVCGLPAAQSVAMVELVERTMAGAADISAIPEGLAPLLGVVPFPGRHGCALMPWQALREALAGQG